MRDLMSQLRDYGEQLDREAPSLAEIAAPMQPSRPQRRAFSPWATAVATAVAVLLVIGGVAILLTRPDQNVGPIDQPGVTTPPPTAPLSTQQPAPASTAVSTVVPASTWTVASMDPPVLPACCDMPVIGPMSPTGEIPAENWPADGFYAITANRPPGSSGTIELNVSRWVACGDLPGRCAPGWPADGVGDDPATAVPRTLPLDDRATVVIFPITESLEPSATPTAVIGSGTAFAELLGNLDAAYAEWVVKPIEKGRSLPEIVGDIVTLANDPSFPFGPEPYTGAIAYRGPLGSALLADPTRIPAEQWPSGKGGLYGWWLTLEIRDGAPVLYVHAGLIAG